MTRPQLNTLTLALLVASVVLSIAFKGFFLFLLIPAAFIWGKGKSGEKRE